MNAEWGSGHRKSEKRTTQSMNTQGHGRPRCSGWSVPTAVPQGAVSATISRYSDTCSDSTRKTFRDLGDTGHTTPAKARVHHDLHSKGNRPRRASGRSFTASSYASQVRFQSTPTVQALYYRPGRLETRQISCQRDSRNGPISRPDLPKPTTGSECLSPR